MTDTFWEKDMPGSLNNAAHIKILLVYLCEKYQGKLTQQKLIDILTAGEIANYFEITAAISQLISQSQLQLDDSDYLLLGSQFQTTKLLYGELPKSIVEKAVEYIDEYFEALNNQYKPFVKIIRMSDGYLVKCALPDVGSNLFEVALFAPNMDKALEIKETFLRDHQKIYKYNLYLFTGENFEI